MSSQLSEKLGEAAFGKMSEGGPLGSKIKGGAVALAAAIAPDVIKEGADIFKNLEPRQQDRIIDIAAAQIEIPAKLLEKAGTTSIDKAAVLSDIILNASKDPKQADNLASFFVKLSKSSDDSIQSFAHAYVSWWKTWAEVAGVVGTTIETGALKGTELFGDVVADIAAIPSDVASEFVRGPSKLAVAAIEGYKDVKEALAAGGAPVAACTTAAMLVLVIIFLAALAVWVMRGEHKKQKFGSPMDKVLVFAGSMIVVIGSYKIFA